MINLAFIAIIVGVTILRFTWRKTGIYFTLARTTAWGVIIFAHIVLSNTIGSEFGITFGLSALGIAGFMLAFFNRENRGAYKTASRYNTDANAPVPLTPNIAAPNITIFKQNLQKIIKPKIKPILKKSSVFLLVGPFALLSTGLLSIFVVFLIPVRLDIQMAIAAFLFPTLYAFATYYLCASGKHIKNTICLSVLSGIAAGYLFL